MSSNPPEMPEAPEPGERQQQLPPVPAELPPIPPELPPIPPQQSYQPYQQYQPAQQQYPPVPQPQYPPGWQPPPPAGGKIWLGILLIVRSVRTTESRSRADLVADQPQNMPIPCHQGPQGMGCILFRALTAK